MRNITGTVLTVDGLPVASTEVSFTLVDVNTKPTSSFDAITYDRVYGTQSTVTDTNGTFTISLYENSKLIDITSYLVRVDVANDVPFKASLTEGIADIDWLEFKAGGSDVTPAQLLILEEYMNRTEAAVLATEADVAQTAASATAAANSATSSASSSSSAEGYAVAASTSGSYAQAARLAAEAAYDLFDDRYLGGKAVAPTLDNDGNALSVSAQYFNTVDLVTYTWSGTAWINQVGDLAAALDAINGVVV